MDRDLMQEAAALYALPSEEYTAARNARAKELRKEKPELAAQVAKLPKPSAPAAAINRVARDDPSEVRALVQAGRALRSAQEAAVAGKSAGAVADAARDHRAALERVTRELRRLGLSAGVVERAVATLRAASVDPEQQPLLERGLLAREVEAAGFGIDPALVPAAREPRSTVAPRRSDARERREALKAAQAGLAAAKRELRDAVQARKRAEAELGAARDAEERAAAAVADAEAEVDAARSAGRGRG